MVAAILPGDACDQSALGCTHCRNFMNRDVAGIKSRLLPLSAIIFIAMYRQDLSKATSDSTPTSKYSRGRELAAAIDGAGLIPSKPYRQDLGLLLNLT